MGDADDKALYAGFRARDVALTALFLALLRPAIRSRIKSRWKSLRHVHADMASHCEDTLIEWREAGTLRADESVDDLASRLVRASAVVFQRADERHQRIGEAAAADPPERGDDPEGAVVSADLRERVWELQAKLPAQHQQVLEAYAAAESGGQSMAEILGVSAETARKMAQRARAALYAVIKEANLTAADFFDGATGDNDA